MAHQAHNIPWHILATHLKWKNMRTTFPADLHPDFSKAEREARNKQMMYFVDEFVKNIKEHAKNERAKFPETYHTPNLDEVIVSDAQARKLGPAMHSMVNFVGKEMLEKYPVGDVYSGGLCKHRDGGGCGCAIPYEERRARAFVRKYHWNECYRFFRDNAKAFYNLVLVELLLLHGEMDTVLRVCSLPGVDLPKWHTMFLCYCEYPDVGWNRLYEVALHAYICLNVLYCFPQTWHPEQRTPDERDYRASKCYQKMLKDCTHSKDSSEIPMLPHQQFFGIDRGQFDVGTRGKQPTYGVLSLDTFLAVRKNPRDHIPHVDDVLEVRRALRSKGLPMELVLDILQKADYKPKRRLRVADDPLHPDNMEELAEYLKHCWQVLVRCEVMAEALPEHRELPIPWRSVVREAVNRFGFGVPSDEDEEY